MLVVCLLQEGSNKNQSQTFGQGHGAMNDLITAHESCVMKWMLFIIWTDLRAPTWHVWIMLRETLQPHSSRVLYSSGLFFLGEDEKEVLQSFWKEQQTARNCESARAETMIPSSGSQRQPGANKMDRGHQKHLQWQPRLRLRGVTRTTTLETLQKMWFIMVPFPQSVCLSGGIA